MRNTKKRMKSLFLVFAAVLIYIACVPLICTSVSAYEENLTSTPNWLADVADIHSGIGRDIQKMSQEILGGYKQTSYHKELVSGWKEVKIAEKGFAKAQKPWLKSLTKVAKTQRVS